MNHWEVSGLLDKKHTRTQTRLTVFTPISLYLECVGLSFCLSLWPLGKRICYERWSEIISCCVGIPGIRDDVASSVGITNVWSVKSWNLKKKHFDGRGRWDLTGLLSRENHCLQPNAFDNNYTYENCAIEKKSAETETQQDTGGSPWVAVGLTRVYILEICFLQFLALRRQSVNRKLTDWLPAQAHGVTVT